MIETFYIGFIMGNFSLWLFYRHYLYKNIHESYSQSERRIN